MTVETMLGQQFSCPPQIPDSFYESLRLQRQQIETANYFSQNYTGALPKEPSSVTSQDPQISPVEAPHAALKEESFDEAEYEESDKEDGADLNENVEEIKLVISPINPEDFDFVEESETSYSEKTQRDRLLENRGQTSLFISLVKDMEFCKSSVTPFKYSTTTFCSLTNSNSTFKRIFSICPSNPSLSTSFLDIPETFCSALHTVNCNAFGPKTSS